MKAAEDALFDGDRPATRISYKNNPKELETLQDMLHKPLDVDEQEWNELEFLHQHVRVVGRSGTGYTRQHQNQHEAVQGMIENAISAHFRRLAIPMIILGTFLSVIGAIPLTTLFPST